MPHFESGIAVDYDVRRDFGVPHTQGENVHGQEQRVGDFKKTAIGIADSQEVRLASMIGSAFALCSMLTALARYADPVGDVSVECLAARGAVGRAKKQKGPKRGTRGRSPENFRRRL
jgi:hypothetical protein